MADLWKVARIASKVLSQERTAEQLEYITARIAEYLERNNQAFAYAAFSYRDLDTSSLESIQRWLSTFLVDTVQKKCDMAISLKITSSNEETNPVLTALGFQQSQDGRDWELEIA